MSNYNEDSIDLNLDTQESEELREYRSLWRAVILQALVDSTSNSSRTENKIAKYQAQQWLLGNSCDLQTVCDLADYNSTKLKAVAINRIQKVVQEKDPV